jgi:acetyl-CoA carboxylase carboxyl transferase subunit beta
MSITFNRFRKYVTADADHVGASCKVTYSLDFLAGEVEGDVARVLCVGYGNPLKSCVLAARDAGIKQLFATGTHDKARGFSFGGAASVVELAPKFDSKLFTNDFVVLNAIDTAKANVCLWAQRSKPSRVVREACARAGVLLLVPSDGDKMRATWELLVEADISDVPEIIYSQDKLDHAIDVCAWKRCRHCKDTHAEPVLREAGWKCPTCGELVALSGIERIEETVDADSFIEWDSDVAERNALEFPDFDGIIERAREKSGVAEGVLCGRATLEDIPLAIGIMETSFLMGSMGYVVGEKLARLFERATVERLPVVIFCASGGARMQEGLDSLMQMAKVSAAAAAHSAAGLLYISVICDPTTGGVSASFAALGDIILAEPHALYGFAGRRVIQNTIKQALPADFQTAEFALEHGLVDAIIPREEMRATLSILLEHHAASQQSMSTASDVPVGVEEGCAASDVTPTGTSEATDESAPAGAVAVGAGASAKASAASCKPCNACCRDTRSEAKGVAITGALRDGAVCNPSDSIANCLASANAFDPCACTDGSYSSVVSSEVAESSLKADGARFTFPANNREGSAWDRVKLARDSKRPTAAFYIASVFDDFIELHGDRQGADDAGIIGGVGKIDGRSVTIIAQEKGADLKDRIKRNFGCTQPTGFRKARRLMEQAQKFNRPIICLVDTQGAFCGKSAEEGGVGGAIAENLAYMSTLTVPVISVVLGEGGSGGALGLAVANRVAMQENAVYSILSPEGFASILWKDASRAPEAAEVMKMCAADAYTMGIVDAVIAEGEGSASKSAPEAATHLWEYLTSTLSELDNVPPAELAQMRYERFRKF